MLSKYLMISSLAVAGIIAGIYCFPWMQDALVVVGIIPAAVFMVCLFDYMAGEEW